MNHSTKRLAVLIVIALFAFCAAAQNVVQDKAPQGSRKEIFRSFKTMYVGSNTSFLEPAVMTAELQKGDTLDNAGISIVDSPMATDTMLTVDHQKLTFDYTYKLVHRETGMVLVSGKFIAFDGPRAAAGLASDLLKRISKERNLTAKPSK